MLSRKKIIDEDKHDLKLCILWYIKLYFAKLLLLDITETLSIIIILHLFFRYSVKNKINENVSKQNYF